MKKASTKFYAPRGGNPSIPVPAALIAARVFAIYAQNQTMALD
jgi:hypothetical protein